ncbi:hypothetical protein ACIBM3_30365 [Rhodococcus erythropolis]|uniref:hypothetical protein n=1 Tax=Rhodococcus erythropolis TaxID=1833 RepID=UPI0037972ADB
MRVITRAAFPAAGAIPLSLATPALAAAADADDVTFAYAVDGSTVTNTITNNSETPLTCATSLGLAPGGVLPPVEVILSGGQSFYDQGVVAPGATTQVITDVPDGSYVVLVSCGSDGDNPSMWVSAHPGIEGYLSLLPYTSYVVQQASSVITIPAPVLSPPA